MKDLIQLEQEMESSLAEQKVTFEADLAKQRDDLFHEIEEERGALENRQQELQSELAQFHFDRQRAAMSNLLSRPWRQDREAVSAAFSKWVRVTMFENAAEEEAGLRAAQSELDGTLSALETNREDLNNMMIGLDRRSVEISEKELELEVAKGKVDDDAKALAEERQNIEEQKALVDDRRNESLRELEERKNRVRGA